MASGQETYKIAQFNILDLKPSEVLAIVKNDTWLTSPLRKVDGDRFIKYEIIELGKGYILKFGPKNFKRAKQITAIVEYTNIHNIKMKWCILKDGYIELIEVI